MNPSVAMRCGCMRTSISGSVRVDPQPLSAGVLLPHTAYPAGIREVCEVLTGTWLVAALRENAPALMLVECGVSALWLVLGLALLMVAGQLRYRSGRTDLL